MKDLFKTKIFFEREYVAEIFAEVGNEHELTMINEVIWQNDETQRVVKLWKITFHIL